MLKRLDVQNFRAFERFTVTFGPDAFLVGANNAGKSTIIAALRAVARMIAVGKNRNPDTRVSDDGRNYLGHNISEDQLELGRENLRHEFRNVETRIRAHFEGGARVCAVWPPAEDDRELWEAEAGFYFSVEDRTQPRRPKDIRALFPNVGIIPVLGPLETFERVLAESTVKRNVDGRLASRHFRNQLFLLQQQAWPWSGDFGGLLQYTHEWTPEIELRDLRDRLASEGRELDLFHREEGSRFEKEMAWAGDGLQVWLQILFHLYRLRDAETIILDEPDVYLHPDLQRRLVSLLESQTAQTVTATHSPEVLAEADNASVVWVDKTKARAKRGPQASELTQVAAAIGSQFNVRLAKALRSRLVVFVEGTDMKLVRHIAGTIGAAAIARERGVTVIPLEGFDNWTHVEPFVWMSRQLLEDALHIAVVLDRDYRPDSAAADVERRLAEAGIRGHVWRRKELENYLLEPPVIARLSGRDEGEVEALLDHCADALRSKTLARRHFEAQQFFGGTGEHPVTTNERVEQEFQNKWSDRATRWSLCPAKEMLACLNRALEQEGGKSVSTRAIARRIAASEIPEEMTELLLGLDGLAVG